MSVSQEPDVLSRRVLRLLGRGTGRKSGLRLRVGLETTSEHSPQVLPFSRVVNPVLRRVPRQRVGI